MTWAHGACLCGAIRFEVALPVKWCAYCHCGKRRQAHGAPYVAWLGVIKATAFRLLVGEPRTYASTPDAKRSFCGTCGSPLFFESTRWADEIHIARAAIPGPIDRTPQAHCFYSDKADWVDLDAPLPKLGGANGTTPLE